MKVIIYGRPQCPYCVKAIELCDDKGVEYEYHTVGEHITREELIDKIHDVSGDPDIVVRTVPQVFMVKDDNEEYVSGGYEGLYKKLI